jgi:hypothetical protein
MHLTKCIVGMPIVLKTMTARRLPLYFRTVGGQENHVEGALFIESGVVRE